MREKRPTLRPQYLEQQRKRLEVLQEQILGGEERTIVDERTALEVRGDEPEDSGDRSAIMAQHEITEALHDVDKRRLSDIERAIQKIADGTYGLSDFSGNPIPEERLRATPEAILTVQEEGRRQKNKHR
jgi:DnaK suppressor protein